MIPRAWEKVGKKDILKKLQIVIISQESGGYSWRRWRRNKSNQIR
jgi:hypothetical protein